MKRLRIAMVIVIALMFVSGNVLWAEGKPNVNCPSLDKLNEDKQTMEELSVFYEKMESALKNEEIESMMIIYADDYLHHGIRKSQLRFMWLEIFNNYDNIYSSHLFTNVDQSEEDVILMCTGDLFGIPHGSMTGEFETIGSWSKVNHWLSKMRGEWKMLGGGSLIKTSAPGEERHPLF